MTLLFCAKHVRWTVNPFTVNNLDIGNWRELTPSRRVFVTGIASFASRGGRLAEGTLQASAMSSSPPGQSRYLKGHMKTIGYM